MLRERFKLGTIEQGFDVVQIKISGLADGIYLFLQVMANKLLTDFRTAATQ